jgi:hypothetical protein
VDGSAASGQRCVKSVALAPNGSREGGALIRIKTFLRRSLASGAWSVRYGRRSPKGMPGEQVRKCE